MDGQINKQSVKISIIVPFYNIENYVAQCLDSILIQDMPDFEIIAVNDGSTDATFPLLESYAAKDCRIKVLNLKNGGVSWARNHGVAKAIGEFIMFVDGDDFILPGCLSKLYNYAIANNADAIIFSYKNCIDGVFTDSIRLSYPKDTLMDTVTATRMLLLGGDVVVCNKMFRRSLYIESNILFKEGTTCEDMPVSCKMLLKSNRIFYSGDYFYAYVYRDASIMTSPKTGKFVKSLIYNLDIMGEEIRRSHWEKELTPAFDYRYNRVLISQLFECYSKPGKYESPEELEEAKEFLEQKFSEIPLNRIFANPHFKFYYKLKVLRLKIGLYKYEKMFLRVLKGKR